MWEWCGRTARSPATTSSSPRCWRRESPTLRKRARSLLVRLSPHTPVPLPPSTALVLLSSSLPSHANCHPLPFGEQASPSSPCSPSLPRPSPRCSIGLRERGLRASTSMMARGLRWVGCFLSLSLSLRRGFSTGRDGLRWCSLA